MKRLLFAVALSFAGLFAVTSDAHAQWGTSNSSSWSQSYSSNWSSSQGFGPNGYYNNNQFNEQRQGSFSQNRGYTTPWGGGNRGTTQQWGTRRSTFNNSGWTPSGGNFNNQGGSFDSYNRGRNHNNHWVW